MTRLLITVAVAAVLGVIAYAFGDAITGDSAWALAFGAIAFALGFALAAMATTSRDEDHRDQRTPSS